MVLGVPQRVVVVEQASVPRVPASFGMPDVDVLGPVQERGEPVGVFLGCLGNFYKITVLQERLQEGGRVPCGRGSNVYHDAHQQKQVEHVKITRKYLIL